LSGSCGKPSLSVTNLSESAITPNVGHLELPRFRII
jgi:hypothetical protein